jgi:hypothetical protein
VTLANWVIEKFHGTVVTLVARALLCYVVEGEKIREGCQREATGSAKLARRESTCNSLGPYHSPSHHRRSHQDHHRKSADGLGIKEHHSPSDQLPLLVQIIATYTMFSISVAYTPRSISSNINLRYPPQFIIHNRLRGTPGLSIRMPLEGTTSLVPYAPGSSVMFLLRSATSLDSRLKHRPRRTISTIPAAHSTSDLRTSHTVCN